MTERPIVYLRIREHRRMDFDQIRQRYAGKAIQEWERLCSTPIMRIEYMITTHFLNRYLPKSGLILDAGSGPGRYAVDLVRKGYRVVMFDLLHEMLQLGQQKVAENKMQEKVMLVEGNIVRLPYKDNSFDAVIIGVHSHPKWTIDLPDGSKIQQLTFFFQMEGEMSTIHIQASEIAAYQFFAPDEIPEDTFECCKQKVSDWRQFQGQVFFR